MVALPPMGDPIQTAGAKGQGASQKTAKLPSDTMQTGRDESTGDTATNLQNNFENLDPGEVDAQYALIASQLKARLKTAQSKLDADDRAETRQEVEELIATSASVAAAYLLYRASYAGVMTVDEYTKRSLKANADLIDQYGKDPVNWALGNPDPRWFDPSQKLEPLLPGGRPRYMLPDVQVDELTRDFVNRLIPTWAGGGQGGVVTNAVQRATKRLFPNPVIGGRPYTNTLQDILTVQYDYFNSSPLVSRVTNTMAYVRDSIIDQSGTGTTLSQFLGLDPKDPLAGGSDYDWTVTSAINDWLDKDIDPEDMQHDPRLFRDWRAAENTVGNNRPYTLPDFINTIGTGHERDLLKVGQRRISELLQAFNDTGERIVNNTFLYRLFDQSANTSKLVASLDDDDIFFDTYYDDVRNADEDEDDYLDAEDYTIDNDFNPYGNTNPFDTNPFDTNPFDSIQPGNLIRTPVPFQAINFKKLKPTQLPAGALDTHVANTHQLENKGVAYEGGVSPFNDGTEFGMEGAMPLGRHGGYFGKNGKLDKVMLKTLPAMLDDAGAAGATVRGLGEGLGKASELLGPAMYILDVVGTEGKYKQDQLTKRERTVEEGGNAARLVGGAAGGMAAAILAGATIGSVVPGAGTVVGGAVGFVAGLVGGAGGALAGDIVGKDAAGAIYDAADSGAGNEHDRKVLANRRMNAEAAAANAFDTKNRAAIIQEVHAREAAAGGETPEDVLRAIAMFKH